MVEAVYDGIPAFGCDHTIPKGKGRFSGSSVDVRVRLSGFLPSALRGAPPWEDSLSQVSFVGSAGPLMGCPSLVGVVYEKI